MEDSSKNRESKSAENPNPDGVIETPLVIRYHACEYKQEGTILRQRKARKKYIDILDGGAGYETLVKLRERMTSHLNDCEEKIEKAAHLCKMPDEYGRLPTGILKEFGGDYVWFGPRVDESSYRTFSTEPPSQRGFRVVNVSRDGLAEMPERGQDPNDPAFFWLMRHRERLLELSKAAVSRETWDYNLEVIINVLGEFEGDLEVQDPVAYIDFDTVGPEDPAVLRKLKAIRAALERRPELENEGSNAPIFRAVAEEGLYATEAARPADTIRRGLKENFGDYFKTQELPTNGKEWKQFFEPIDEAARYIEKHGRQNRKYRFD